MTDRIALITGTSSGIGLHTAVGLARAGLHVVATMRDVSKAGPLRAAAETARVQLQVESLDVADAVSAAQRVDAVISEHGRLDVLVNNAGRGSLGTLEQLSLQDLRDQLEVNYLGVAALTKAVLPTMRRQRAGRIVTVTSVGGAVGQPFADAYCGAKFAVEGLMQSLAPVMARFGVQISIVEPGAVASAFVANVDGLDSVTDQESADDPYVDLLAAYSARTRGAFAAAQSSPDAAAVIVEAATTEQPRFRWQTSAGARAFAGLSLADLDGQRVLDQTSTWL